VVLSLAVLQPTLACLLSQDKRPNFMPIEINIKNKELLYAYFNTQIVRQKDFFNIPH
jgi:hypothetical protein